MGTKGGSVVGLVLGDLLVLCCVIGVIGWIFWARSRKLDQVEADRALREEKIAQERLRLDQLRYQPGVKLICLDCNKRFEGPLTDAGCPECHSATLSITEEELKLRGEWERRK